MRQFSTEHLVVLALTPDVHETVPSVFFFTYFATHCGAVVAALLLVFGLRRPIRPGAVGRAFGGRAGAGPLQRAERARAPRQP